MCCTMLNTLPTLPSRYHTTSGRTGSLYLFPRLYQVADAQGEEVELWAGVCLIRLHGMGLVF